MKIQNAFRIGLVGTLGVGLGLLILTSIATLSTIITYIRGVLTEAERVAAATKK